MLNVITNHLLLPVSNKCLKLRQNNGNTILSKVIEIGSTEVKYKKFSNLNGPTYTIAKAEILVINYENGEKESFSNAQLSGSVVNSNNIGKRILSDDELLKKVPASEFDAGTFSSYLK